MAANGLSDIVNSGKFFLKRGFRKTSSTGDENATCKRCWMLCVWKMAAGIMEKLRKITVFSAAFHRSNELKRHKMAKNLSTHYFETGTLMDFLRTLKLKESISWVLGISALVNWIVCGVLKFCPSHCRSCYNLCLQRTRTPSKFLSRQGYDNMTFYMSFVGPEITSCSKSGSLKCMFQCHHLNPIRQNPVLTHHTNCVN